MVLCPFSTLLLAVLVAVGYLHRLAYFPVEQDGLFRFLVHGLVLLRGRGGLVRERVLRLPAIGFAVKVEVSRLVFF